MKRITKKVAAIAMTAVVSTGASLVSAYALNKIKGDVTGDGKVTQADAVLAARKEDGWDVEIDEVAADVDVNGKFDSNDVNAIAKYVAGWSDTSVGDSFTDADPIYTLSVKYRDDIDKSVQDNELDAAVADDEELMMRFLDGEFDDLSKFTKLKSGLTLAEAYAMARMLPDFYVDIDAGGLKADMILTREINGDTGSPDIATVALSADVAGGKAPYTYSWYKKSSYKQNFDFVSDERVYEASVTGLDNFGSEVYCLITDADGKKLQTNTTKLKNITLSVPLSKCKVTGGKYTYGVNCLQCNDDEPQQVNKYTERDNSFGTIGFVDLRAVFEGGSGYSKTEKVLSAETKPGGAPNGDDLFLQSHSYTESYDVSRYSCYITKSRYQREDHEIIYDGTLSEIGSPIISCDHTETLSQFNGTLLDTHVHHAERLCVTLPVRYDDFSDEIWITEHTRYEGSYDTIHVSYDPTIDDPNYFYPEYEITLIDNVTGLREKVTFSYPDAELQKKGDKQ